MRHRNCSTPSMQCKYECILVKTLQTFTVGLKTYFMGNCKQCQCGAKAFQNLKKL